MAAIVFVAVAFLLTAPAWTGPAGVVVGGAEEPDWTGTLWVYWWTGFALRHGMAPFHAVWNYFPVGQEPLSQYNLLDALLAWPLLAAFGPARGYDLFAVFAVASTAMGAWVLARTAGASAAAATVGALALECSQWLLLEVQNGRLTQALMWPFLLALALLVRLARGDGGWGLAVATGLLATATAWTWWYAAPMLAVAAVPLLLASTGRPPLARIALAGAIPVVLSLPAALDLAGRYETLPGVSRAVDAAHDLGPLARGDFDLTMVVRHAHHAGWPLWTAPGDVDDHRIALGVLLLVGVALARSPQRWRWLAVLGSGYVLTLGPYLKDADGLPRAVPLPYLVLFDHLPFFERLWWPARWAMVLYAGLVVLVAKGVDLLAPPGRRRRAAWVALLVGVCFADTPWRNLRVPVPARLPRPYLANLYEGLDGALITLPVMGTTDSGRHNLWFQVHHQLPISTGLGDHLSGHRPPAWEVFVAGNGLMAALGRLSNGSLEGGTVSVSDVDALRAAGFRWVVMDPGAFPPGDEGDWSRAFRMVLETVWGSADRSADRGAAWQVEPISAPLSLPTIPTVRRPRPQGPHR